MTEEEWDRVLAVDLKSMFLATQHAAPVMVDRGRGAIICVSSVAGLRGHGRTAYAAAKAGVIGFTKALALEGASRGVTVNAIAPGYTDTGMVRAVPANILDGIVGAVPVARLAEPAEIARGVLFLVAEDAGFITGATLSINGGKYLA